MSISKTSDEDSIEPELEPQPNSHKLPRNVVALSLVSLFNDASSEIIYPFLPFFITSTLGATVTFVGLIEGIAESTSSLLKLPAGWYSDRLKKRKAIVVIGYGIASLIRPLLALTTAVWQVLGLRFIDRIGKGLRSAPRDAMIADSTPSQLRGLAYGFHRAMDHAGAIVGSLLGAGLAFLFQNDYRKVFWCAAIPALIALLILIFAVRETKRKEDKNGQTSQAPPISFNLSSFTGKFKIFLAILILFTLSNSSDAFLLLRAQQCGISIVALPLLWALLHVSKSLSSVIGGGLSDRWGRKKIIIAGWLIYAAIYFGFAFATNETQIWVLFAVYGTYFGLTEGVEKALVADLVMADQRGTAFGLYNFVIGITALPASLLLGLVWQNFGAETALMSSAVVSLISAALLAKAL
ncbi:MAG TPA: MFS transporter [Blastocatellia bacterium]|nr:MFS transporter [Blastocatellia bacterium]